jgi:prolipoprotein diacylglyceryl transferase
MKRRFKEANVPQMYLESLALYVFLGTFIGARLGHCLFYEPSYYLNNPLEMFLPIKHYEDGWKFIGYRGLASHGAAIGIQIAVIMHAYKTKLPALWSLDRLVMVIALAGLFIRTGNLFNSEIYGDATTMPWGFIFVRTGETIPKHPTQIYEALAYFLIFILLFIVFRKTKGRRGVVFSLFLIILFSMRFLIEFIKEPQVDFEQSMALDMGQILSIPLIIEGIVILVMVLTGKINNSLDLKKLKHKDKK